MKLHSFKLFVTSVATLVISALALSSCAQTEITPDEARHRQRSLHLQLPDGGRLPNHVLLFRG